MEVVKFSENKWVHVKKSFKKAATGKLSPGYPQSVDK